MIKTFRGLIADGGQDTIVLHTNNGSTGYRIVKFEILPRVPGTVSQEDIVKIYTVQQTSIDGVIDFSDDTLLAAAFYSDGADNYPGESVIIVDGMVFNQDIYVTHADVVGTDPCNYYIELEQVKLDLNENTVTTLKNLRTIPH